jgi:phosphoribosylamine--glycine ligase
MLVRREFGSAGSEVLVEEYMEGEELSLFGITNGEWLVPMIAAQDHKRLLDHDRGPNTGGMGAYAPVSLLTPPLARSIITEIFNPALDALRSRGAPFTGLLYAGLMLTRDGPRVVEFNCRFGDPETEAILPLLPSTPSLLDFMLASANDDEPPASAFGAESETTAYPPAISGRQPPLYAVTTVLATAGYPETPRTGDVITVPSASEGVLVFHAGTKRRSDGELVTSGGRVLAVTGTGRSFEEAQRRSREFASRVEFEGRQFRSDIGWRELARVTAGHAGAA